MSQETLLVLAQEKGYNTTDIASKLELLQARGMEQYYDADFVEEHIGELRRPAGDADLSFSWYPHNAPGTWMSHNITADSLVADQPADAESVAAIMESGEHDIGQIVVASYLSGYQDFKRIAEYVRREHPKTKIIAASVGALLPESHSIADYTIGGDHVRGLRALMGEEATAPLRPVYVKAETGALFNGRSKSSEFGLLLSSLGCMYACDFCPSTAQFGNRYEAPFSAEQVRETIVAAHDSIAPESSNFTVSVAEPQGLGNVPLWREIFRLCRDLPFQCDLVTTTSSKVIDKYGMGELTEGNLRLTTVNIGVESLINGYRKNQNVDLKNLIHKLQQNGINVVTTFIVGLDWHTPENVGEETKLLKELDANGYIVANLEMQPGTPLYERYKKEGRLLDVPPELLNFYGFQAFRHPNFKEGFNDMLPLLAGIEAELCEGTQVFDANLATYLRRNNTQEAQKRQEVTRRIQEFKAGLDPALGSMAVSRAVSNFSANLYFDEIFRQVDLFHPFIISTN